VLSDKGWILERLASKLKSSIPFVDYATETDASADIQYYMTYNTWSSRVSKIEIGYFAHIEEDQKTRKKFFDVASSVDFCVCHSSPYETLLRDEGIMNVRSIPPGVDLEFFIPKVKIGIVGRTYHTGRKGERVIAGVFDVPGIEWHFTGTGWPGPALHLSDEEMPEFYRSMDYILVPSLYEGGPMSVIEALACGCEVIAPPIGWVPEFPHIEYRTGDIEDLRRVLTAVVEKRSVLRQSVLHRGWEGWIDGHREVFEKLSRGVDRSSSVGFDLPDGGPDQVVKNPAIIVHGTETGVDKGGPSVRAPATVKRLSRLGYKANLLTALNFDQRDYDIYHIFNLSRLTSCRRAIEYTKLSNAAVILSTIYLDPAERRRSEIEITDIFRHSFSSAMINDEYARIRENAGRRVRRQDEEMKANEEFYAEVRHLISLTDHIICLSEHERTLLRGIGADVSRSTIVRNPVDVGQWSSADREMFQNAYGVSDYVLCVGRLEPRKNQITLLHSLRNTEIPIVLIGHSPDPEYRKLLRSVAGPHATFIDRLPPNSSMLASAFAGARVFCLPSWSEGAPLAALEASAAGCNMVLSDRSSEREYFADRARYCDPGSPEQLATIIQEAYEKPFTAEQKYDLSQWVASQFSWEKHVAETAAVYEKVAVQRQSQVRPLLPPKIYIDITSGANRSGPPSGIARVEERYALDLYDIHPGQVIFIIWNSYRRAFLEISHDQFTQYKHKELHNIQAPAHLFNQRNLAPYASIDFEPGSTLLVLGGAWIRNENYIHSLSATKRVKRLNLVVFVHDVIQGKFKHWFPENIGDEFVRNCRIIVNAADHIVVNSKCTLDDLRDISISDNMICPPVDILRFGDEIEQSGFEFERPQFEEILPLIKGSPFVLYVSALDVRKNHIQLYNVWERMLEEHGDRTPHLIMVGSKGWNIDHFLELVNTNSEIKKVFHILHGINDATLSWLYRHSLFTVYPSRYEGWGLPVAESLNYGKVCIAARAGSVPEIAPEVTDLIDPLDFTGWYKAITNYVFNPNLLSTRRDFVLKNYKPIRWRESAENLSGMLMKVQGRGRPLPVLRVDVPLGFDDHARNNAREIKIGGWYSPEKDGTWTLGSLATLQFKLEGRIDSALILEMAGRGFVAGRDDFQAVTVVSQGVTIAELAWRGEVASDIAIIPRALATDMLASSEVIIELQVARPLVPATVRPNSTDKRQLGVMVKSFGLRAASPLPLDAWVSTRPNSRLGRDIPKPALNHRLLGGLCLKVPLQLEDAVDDKALFFGKWALVGFRLTIGDIAPAAKETMLLEMRIGGNRLGETLLTIGQIVTRFFAVPVTQLRAGAILEIAALDGNVALVDLVEYGLFSSPIVRDILAVPGNVAVSLRQAADRPDAKVKSGSVHWGLDRLFQGGDRQTLLPTFVSGWSRLESDGLWTDGDCACQLMRVAGDPTEPLVLSFEARAFRPMRVTVRINGRAAQVWSCSGRGFQQQVLIYQPQADDKGLLLIEYEPQEAISPAELDGGSDTRKLGIMLASFALLRLDELSVLTTRAKFPTLARNTLIDCATPPLNTMADGGQLTFLGHEAAKPMLLAGWSRSEKAGCWSDGDVVFLYIRPKPDLPKDLGFVLSCNARPFRAMNVEVRVNGKESETIVLKSTRNQDFVVPLPPGCIEDGYLVEFRVTGATAPSEVSDSSDRRRLGLYLRSFAFVETVAQFDALLAARKAPEKMATMPSSPEVRAADTNPAAVPAPKSIPKPDVGSPDKAKPPVVGKSAPRFQPVLMDFSSQVIHRQVSATNWFAEEIHGRWSRGAAASVTVTFPVAPTGPIKLVTILRLFGAAKLGPRPVEILIDGATCSVTTINDDDFHSISVDVTAQIAGKEKVKIGFRCAQPFNPSENGISGDTRDLGVHLRGAALLSGDAASFDELLIPGHDLVGEVV
jgi:glycosyltransferase involved in cell wall biosynthesis